MKEPKFSYKIIFYFYFLVVFSSSFLYWLDCRNDSKDLFLWMAVYWLQILRKMWTVFKRGQNDFLRSVRSGVMIANSLTLFVFWFFWFGCPGWFGNFDFLGITYSVSDLVKFPVAITSATNAHRQRLLKSLLAKQRIRSRVEMKRSKKLKSRKRNRKLKRRSRWRTRKANKLIHNFFFIFFYVNNLKLLKKKKKNIVYFIICFEPNLYGSFPGSLGLSRLTSIVSA